MAVRELLKYPSIADITLVDLDKKMTDLFASNKSLLKLNSNALQSSKVSVINTDAFVWLRENTKAFDFIVVDFPDPSNYSLGKLYTTSFYRELSRSLAPNGALVIQSTSPFVAKKSFWIIDKTLQQTGLHTQPYHCYVPSFGEWGFILGFKNNLGGQYSFPDSLRFLNTETVRQMYVFPPDMVVKESPYNTLEQSGARQYF